MEDLTNDLVVMGIIADYCKNKGVEHVIVSEKIGRILMSGLIKYNGKLETVLDLTSDQVGGYIEYMGVKFSQLDDETPRRDGKHFSYPKFDEVGQMGRFPKE